jgi:transglutaminase-like putative cysteine protease
MTTSAETVDYPIQTATVQGDNPFFSLPSPSVDQSPLPSGTAGTFATLAAMAECVRGEIPPDFCGYRKSAIVDFAARLIEGAENSQQEITKLFDYVAHKIKYLAHPIDQQVIQDACRTIQFKTGDCVSKSTLLATLLCAMDYECKFIAQYFNDDQLYSHVYVLATDVNGQEYRLDPVASDQPMGWTQKLPDGGWETSFNVF